MKSVDEAEAQGENIEGFLEMRNDIAAEARLNGLDERALRTLLRDV
jgi:hypothetical protein